MRAFAGIEALWVLFIVATVIARVIKAAREQKPGTGSAPKAPTGDFTAAEEDLREFMESLTGKKAEKPAPTPEATRPASQPRQYKQPVRQQSRAPERAAVPAPVRAPAEAQRSRPQPRTSAPARQVVERAPKVHDQHVSVEPPLAAVPAAPVPLHVPTRSKQRKPQVDSRIMKDLVDRVAIRKAIVLREILGPPVALRTMSSGSLAPQK